MWEIKLEILHGEENLCVCLISRYHQVLNLSDNQGKNCPETRTQILHSEQMLTRGNLKLYEGNDPVTTAHSEKSSHTYSYIHCSHVTPRGMCASPRESRGSTVISWLSRGQGDHPPLHIFWLFLHFNFKCCSTRVPLSGVLSGYLISFPFSFPILILPFTSHHLILPCLWCLYLSALDCNISL